MTNKLSSYRFVSLLCAYVLSAFPAFSKPEISDKKDRTILVYTQENTSCIEAAILGDVLKLKKKDGTVKEMSMHALNAKGVNDVSTMWNLYCFYIVKDIWRQLTHEDKLMGQANLTVDVTKDGKFKIIRHGLYVPGCPPCLNDAPVPEKAQKFWKQAQNCIKYIEFNDMSIPGKDIESVKFDTIFGRDMEVFPRHEFCNIKGVLLRDMWGKIKREKPLEHAR